MIAVCSGGAGDLVYSIPVLRSLNVDKIYVKVNFYRQPCGNLHATIKRFMESQGFECLPTSGEYPVGSFDPELKYDYNLDDFRKQPHRGLVHIMNNMARQFNVKVDFPPKPWIEGIEDMALGNYSIIHLTERWREGSKVDWKKIKHEIEGKVYFVGLQYEWVDFCARYGDVQWLPTDDIYDLACVVKGAERVYCNQSIVLTLAQGLGKEYFLDRKPGKTNTIMRTKNEHIL